MWKEKAVKGFIIHDKILGLGYLLYLCNVAVALW